MDETPEMMFEKGKRFYMSCAGMADPDLALHYFEKAAEAGYVPAQMLLGTCYLGGGSIPSDFGKAHKWLTLAAKQSDGQAACNLAQMYLKGLGVPIDWGVAYKLLDMKCAFHLAESISLKDQMNDALQGHFPDVVKILATAEMTRRFSYDAHRQRFIQPWETQQVQAEFDTWLGMKLKRVTVEEGQKELLTLLNTYYDAQEALHPRK